MQRKVVNTIPALDRWLDNPFAGTRGLTALPETVAIPLGKESGEISRQGWLIRRARYRDGAWFRICNRDRAASGIAPRRCLHTVGEKRVPGNA